MFNEILKLFSKPVPKPNTTYTSPDVVYVLWRLGYCLGCIRERIGQIRFLKLDDHFDDKLLTDSFRQFTMAFEKAKTLSEIIQGNAAVYQKEMGNVQHALSEKEGVVSADGYCKTLYQLLTFDINAYSVHLKNVFDFGYRFVMVRRKFLYSTSGASIKRELDIFNALLANIDKGDKKLNSPNLELVRENLKIMSINVSLMQKNLAKLCKQRERNYQDFALKIGDSFQLWEDILLDLRNPSEIIRGRVLIIIVYYYFIIIMLGMVQEFVRNVDTGALEAFLDKSEQYVQNLITILILPALIWFFVQLYRYIKRFITFILLKRRFKKLLKG
jgi:hypothetical protein